jgi:hypothetical protein
MSATPACELEYTFDGWNTEVTQDVIITVLGEENGALVADETINIKVPLTKFKQMLVYDGEWDPSIPKDAVGQQPFPKIYFRPCHGDACGDEIAYAFGELKGNNTDPYADRIFTDELGVSHNKFSRVLIDEVTFTDSVLDSNDLPREAIRSVSEGSISVLDVATVVGESSSTDTSQAPYLQSLFEQAVGAGRVKADDDFAASTPSGFNPTESKCPSFQVGDSISFSVRYDFIKTRLYEVDSEVTPGSSLSSEKGLKVTFNGQEITIGNVSEQSDPFSKRYEFKLFAV